MDTALTFRLAFSAAAAIGAVGLAPACSGDSTGSSGSSGGGTGTSTSGSSGTGSGGTGSTGASAGSAGSGSSGNVVSFATTIVPIFQANCSMNGIGCHGDPGVTSVMPSRPYLGPPAPDTVPQATVTAIWSGLMVSSGEDPTMPLVSPRSDTNSYLMHKVDGTQNSLDCSKGDEQGTCGLAMPYTAAMLPQSTRDSIRGWINAGAPNN